MTTWGKNTGSVALSYKDSRSGWKAKWPNFSVVLSQVEGSDVFCYHAGGATKAVKGYTGLGSLDSLSPAKCPGT